MFMRLTTFNRSILTKTMTTNDLEETTTTVETNDEKE